MGHGKIPELSGEHFTVPFPRISRMPYSRRLIRGLLLLPCDFPEGFYGPHRFSPHDRESPQRTILA